MDEHNYATPKPKIAIRRLAEIKAQTKLSRASIYRLVALRKFPKPIRIGEYASGWIGSEVDDWLEERRTARNKETQIDIAREEMVRKALEEPSEPAKVNLTTAKNDTPNPILAKLYKNL